MLCWMNNILAKGMVTCIAIAKVNGWDEKGDIR
jgi:hypothetical protein